MRISNNMMTYNFLRSLNSNLEMQNNLQEQISDGKAIHRPSDDPVKAARALRYNTNLSVNTQYGQNLGDAQSWMNNTDSAMTDLSSIMNKINELVISADNTKPQESLNTIGKEIDELINHIVTIGNTRVGDRYIFAGQNDSTQPFVRTTIKDPYSDKTQEVVLYNGDTSKISMPITTGAANPNQDSVNLTGDQVFGPVTNIYGRQTVDVLNHLLEIKNELMQSSSVQQTNSKGGIGTVTGNYTGAGFVSYDIRLDNVNAGGQVTAASYSTDGGNTWQSVPAASLTAGDPSVLDLGNGVKFSITASPDNAVQNVYSFRVPQTDGGVTQSNKNAGSAVVTGVYTGSSSSTAYTVRVTSVNPATGQITGVDYSTTGGSPERAVQVDNNSDGYDDATGEPMQAQDINWQTVAATDIDNTNPAVTVITLSNGIKLNIDTNTNNKTQMTYSFQVPQNSGSNVQWLSAVATKYVQNDHNMQLKAQTELGTRMSMYEMASNMMQNENAVITTDISRSEDLDVSRAIIDFNTAQTVYSSALAVGARIMPTSLVDFLK